MLLDEDWLQRLTRYRKLFVGFSGGLDSTVLLHSLAQQPPLLSKLQAVHVHHGLSINATDWEHHCQQFCAALSIPFIARHVEINAQVNIEEGARVVRYQVFSSLLSENDCVLLAHHRDDQAETLLLQLFRGAGVDGMAAMPPVKEMAVGALARPLLQHSRQTLEAYAHQHQLSWIDDESNQNSAFSRNYLRHQIMPLLQVKWPGVVNNLVRSATHCQQAKLNLDALAKIDYMGLAESRDTLALPQLKNLERPRLANVLRVWLKNNRARCPSDTMLGRLIDEIILVRTDANPFVQWDKVTIRRYQQTLYLLKNEVVTRQSCAEWSTFPAPLRISVNQHLHASRDARGLLVPAGSQVHVRFRQGGELFYWRGQTKQLKKLLQQWHIPPWQRDSVPLLYIDGVLAAVVGFAISDHYYGEEPAVTYQITT